MSGLGEPQERPDPGEPLIDLPLRSDSEQAASPPAPTGALRENAAVAVPLSARGIAFASDAATVLLLVCGAALGAMTVRGAAPAPPGLAWAAAFAAYLSLFVTAVPLVLFGRTVGMALTGLTARGRAGRSLSAAEASLRWLGSLLTLATLGAVLLFTRRDPGAPSLADRMSGRPLIRIES